jgi:hypothetical protein
MSNHDPEPARRPARRCPEQVEPDRGHHTERRVLRRLPWPRVPTSSAASATSSSRQGPYWLRRFASAVCQPLAAPPERRQDGSCEEDRWGRGLPAVARDYLAPWMAHLLVVVRSIFGTAEPWFGAARSGSRGLSLLGDDQRRWVGPEKHVDGATPGGEFSRSGSLLSRRSTSVGLSRPGFGALASTTNVGGALLPSRPWKLPLVRVTWRCVVRRRRRSTSAGCRPLLLSFVDRIESML